MNHALHYFLEESASHRSQHPAIDEPGVGIISYGELDALANTVRDYLVDVGVRPGDRVGICLRKSIDAIASIFGILKSGAAYVPVDSSAPPARNAFIFSDCSVATIILEKRFCDEIMSNWPNSSAVPNLLELENSGGGTYLEKALAPGTCPRVESFQSAPDDLAYILYTSGSTGKPKGVMLSHRNATSFINWCSEVLQPTQDDRFSSHAPLHFDLSILDLYLSIKKGGTLVLIDESVGKAPARLAPLMAETRISFWYSTPSILSLLAQYGKLEQHELSSLRVVLFAGEVFPIKHLRELKGLLPEPKYFNLYGPTETNVCTYFEIPRTIPDDRITPFPIGVTCSHVETIVIDENGKSISSGQEGELCVAGAGVTQGYWNLPIHTSNAFGDFGSPEKKWYKTGDVVIQQADGNYLFVGRRDRMVKKRGYRVELGEIESGLYRHPKIKEAAAIATNDEENGVRIMAFLSCHDGKRPSMIELKGFCAKNLPSYMIPDLFSFHDTLPKTSTDKIDYQKLKTMVSC